MRIKNGKSLASRKDLVKFKNEVLKVIREIRENNAAFLEEDRKFWERFKAKKAQFSSS